MSTDADKRLDSAERDIRALLVGQGELKERSRTFESLLQDHREFCPADNVRSECSQMIGQIDDKISSRDKLFGRIVGILVALTLVFSGSIMTLHNTKVSKDDFKEFRTIYIANEEKRDEQFSKSVEDQLQITRDILKEMTQIKVAVGETSTELSAIGAKLNDHVRATQGVGGN